MPTFNYYLDKRRAKDTGKYPIKICIYRKPTSLYITTGVDLTHEEYKQVLSESCPDDLMKMRMELRTYKRIVTELYENNPELSGRQLNKLFEKAKLFYTKKKTVNVSLLRIEDIEKPRSKENVLFWFAKYATEHLVPMGKTTGTIELHYQSMAFFKAVVHAEFISFDIFTPKWLYDMENKIESQEGITLSTFGRHCRQLRCVFNFAIENNAVSQKLYPFKKYIILTSSKRKKSLSADDLRRFMLYVPRTKYEQRNHDLFVFSFFGNGLNLRDVLQLRYSNIVDDLFIEFTRTKGRRTKTNPKKIIIPLISELRDIIDRHKRTNKPKQNERIFDVFDTVMTEPEMHKKMKSLSSSIRGGLNIIAKKVGIEIEIAHGVSRHTFANVLKQGKIPTSVISELLGHSTVGVTDHYTSSIGSPMHEENTSILRQFLRDRSLE